MFGSALKCLQDYVTNDYGVEKWQALLQKAGLPRNKNYHSVRFYPDTDFQQLLDASSQELKVDKNKLLRKFGRLFGQHLLNTYNRMFLDSWTSLDIIEKVAPKIFVTIQFVDPYTPNSTVRCNRVASDEVVVHYQSPRKMCVYICGIIDAVADYFNETLEITENTCMLQGDSECQLLVKRV